MLALGIYSGVIAALVITPSVLPVLARLIAAEQQASIVELAVRVAKVGLAIDQGADPAAELGGAQYVRAIDPQGRLVFEQGVAPVDLALEDRVCNHPARVLGLDDDRSLAASCFQNTTLRVFAVWRRPVHTYWDLGLFVVMMATVGGLVTALGTLQLLKPVARVSDALVKLGQGSRKVRLELTGIAEVDELVLRLNAAAAAVEEREHNILARVQVVQELARLVAHEVRNPLQSLELLTALVASEDDADERRELTKSIHAEIRALDDVVTRLLREGSTRGALRLKLLPCDVGALVRHLCNVRSPEAARKGARIEASADEAGTADLDRGMFSRALENLVANAIRAVPGGDGLVRVTAHGDGESLVVWVDDNGPGVDPTLGDSVFEPNVSGEDGTGLGLALTKGVIEGHGGTVALGRSPVGGARFEIRIPRAAAAGTR